MDVAAEITTTSSYVPMPRRASVGPSLVDTLNVVFVRSQPRWRATGLKRRRRCQFVALGSPGRDFYVVVDADGARAVAGTCARPHAVWSSDAASIEAAFAGGPRSKHVRVGGDVESLLAIVRDVVALRGSAFRSAAV